MGDAGGNSPIDEVFVVATAETDGSPYSVIVANSILSATDYLGNYSPNNLTKAESGASFTLSQCEKFVSDKTGADPQFVADDPAWHGDPINAFNSQAFGPTSGYWMGETWVRDGRARPRTFELQPNFPNPFNPSTTIPFLLHNDTHVNVQIYNARGQLVDNLVHEYRTAGHHSIEFCAPHLPSGLYFYQLTAGDGSSVRSMLLLQ